jgi:hypothetical protein
VVVSAKLDTDFLHGYTDFGWLNLCIRAQIRVRLSSYKNNQKLNIEEVLPMYPIDYIIAREHHKELLREAEQERLIRAIRSQQANHGGGFGKIANWVGAQMRKWGSKLGDNGLKPVAYRPQGVPLEE